MKSKRLLLSLLLMAMFAPLAMNAQETLTVYDGTTTNRNVPMYVYYFDAYARSQYIIPAADLQDMTCGTINSIHYYTSYTSAYTPGCDVTVSMKEVDYTTLSSFVDMSDATTVYNGTAEFTLVNEKAEITFNFTTPFAYNGGNLLIECKNEAKDDYKSIYFYGQNISGTNTAVYGSNSSATPTSGGTTQQFIPKTTFTYTPSPYAAPATISYTNVEPGKTTVSWTAPNTSETVTGYGYRYKLATDTDWPAFVTADATTTSVTLASLEYGKDYDFEVKTIYGSNESCIAKSVSFTTLEACMTPENLQITDVFAHSAKLNWTEGYGNGEWKLGYKTTADADFTYVDVVAANLPYTLSGLTGETAYNLIVYPLCDETKSVTGSFTTTVACPTPTALAVTLTPGDGTVATFNWTENGLAAEWELCLDGDESNLITMDSNPFTYDQFTPEQTYTAKVRAVCGGEDGESAWSSTITFTPTDAYTLTVNDGTNTNNYVPFYGLYADSDANSQFIIPASALTYIQWGTIDKLTFYANTASATWNGAVYDVYVAEVSNTEFASNTFVDWSTMTKVYTGSVSLVNNKLELTLTSFLYQGGNLLIGFDETSNSSNYPSTGWYGVTQTTNTAIYQYNNGSINLAKFLPKTTIEYTPGTAPTCNMPTGLEVVGTPEAHKVVLQWTETGTASEWQLCLNGDETNPINVTENPYTLEGIASDTDFTVKVRAYCSDSDQSPWTTEISFHTAVACEKPTNLVITYTGGDTAEVSWDSESTITNFNIDVNGVVKAITGNTYSLTDLQLATTYTVKVQSDCGGGEVSAWVSDSFTTDLCLPADMCEITFELTDAWGDGWNGAYIEIVDVLTASSLGTVTNQNLNGTTGSGENELNTVTFAVCDGRDIQFVWHSGSYDGECSFVILDAKDVEIVSGDSSDLPYTYTVNCPTCFKPKNLAVTNITINSADLSWDGTSDSYVLQYRPWLPAGDDVQPTGNVMVSATYDLSGFTGTGSVVIRHYNCYNQFALIVDDIVVTNASNEVVFSEDFETSNGNMPSKFTNMDMDGDGHVWEIAASPSMRVNGSYGLASFSYDNDTGAELYPDNWLIINNIPMGGQITFNYCAQDDSWTAETFCVYVSTEVSIVEVPLTATTYAVDGLVPNTPYAWQVKGICGAEQTSFASSFFQTLNDVIIFQTDGAWTDAANWDVNRVPTADDKVQIDAEATINSGDIAYAKTTSIKNTGSITIKDGGQLKQGTPTIDVTVEKVIYGHDTVSANGGWNLIATPLSTTLFASTASGWPHADNLTNGNFDLYSFDAAQEGSEWYNYQAHAADFTKLYPTQGYLYANKDGLVTEPLKFVGTTYGKSLNNTVSIDFVYDATSNTQFNGFMLLGNPFTCKAYLAFTPESGYTPSSDVDFYVMNDEGNGFELSNRPLNVCEGAFFYGEGNGTITIATEAPTTKGARLDMTLTQGQGRVDQARVRFGEGMNLKHMSFRDGSKLYIPQNNKDYAVVYAENQGEMPVNFKAESNGNYTISFSSENTEFSYLHLIDNMTGNDVDLLATPSYSFDARTTDYASRFRLVFATGNADDSFAFIGNGEIILSGVNSNSTVQLFDVTGRMISSTNGANRIAIDNMAAGVYMLRLINGNDVKTQKIVVR